MVFLGISGIDYSLFCEYQFEDQRVRDFVALGDWDSDGDVEVVMAGQGHAAGPCSLTEPATSDISIYSYSAGQLQLENAFQFDKRVEYFLEPLISDVNLRRLSGAGSPVAGPQFEGDRNTGVDGG